MIEKQVSSAVNANSCGHGRKERKGSIVKKFAKNIGIYIALFAIVLMVAFFYKGADADQVTVKEVPFSKLVQYLDSEQVSEINFTDTKVTGKISDKEYVYAYINSSVEWMSVWDDYVYPQMQEGKIKKMTSDPPDNGSVFLNLLPTIIMVVALVFLFYFMMNQGGNGKAFQFAKSRILQ